MYYEVCLRNHLHFARYEADNVLISIQNEEHAEAVIQERASAWDAGECYFIGVFNRLTNEFTAQIYIGPVNFMRRNMRSVSLWMINIKVRDTSQKLRKSQ